MNKKGIFILCMLFVVFMGQTCFAASAPTTLYMVIRDDKDGQNVYHEMKTQDTNLIKNVYTASIANAHTLKISINGEAFASFEKKNTTLSNNSYKAILSNAQVDEEIKYLRGKILNNEVGFVYYREDGLLNTRVFIYGSKISVNSKFYEKLREGGKELKMEFAGKLIIRLKPYPKFKQHNLRVQHK